MRRLLLPLVATATFAACGDDDAGPADAGADANAFDRPSGFVGCDTAVEYEDGLEVTTDSGNHAVRFVSATPSPPDVGNDNVWTLEVVPLETAMSEPLVGASITIEPWMPGHGHGVAPPTFTATTGDDGRATIGPFPIIMPGFWEFRTSVSTPDGAADSVVLSFCVEG